MLSLIFSLYSPPDQSKVESPSELLPTPKAKLTFSPPPEETEGESFAKKIVSEILGRSVERFRDSLIEGETTQDDDESKVEPSEEEKGEMNKSPHDNYVNYDIAQTVLESTARRKSPSPAAGTYAYVNNLHNCWKVVMNHISYYLECHTTLHFIVFLLPFLSLLSPSPLPHPPSPFFLSPPSPTRR